ncbi:MAG: HEAT repeat domain-containing protein [Rhodospirillaceae bacterium]
MDETHYRAAVGRVFNRLILTGLPERDARLGELPLDKIFVRLSVDVPAPGEWTPISEIRLGDSLHLGVKEFLKARQRMAIRSEPTTVPLSVAEALSQHRRLVMVGAPGSGKTTLLRWLATTFAAERQNEPDRLGPGFGDGTPWLPVMLELRRFADRFATLSREPQTFDLAEEAESFIASDARFKNDTPPGLIKQAIAAGRCLILLDGLDEIAESGTRQRLIEAVEALFLDPSRPSAGNLCLITTRPHGFATLALGMGFTRTTIRPFKDDEISSFIRSWYDIAYHDPAEAETLVAIVLKNERVKALAINPLLCTIITIVYRNNRVLPERRVELYEKCCEAMLDTWERNKEIKDSCLIGGYSWRTKLDLLAVLALWMHGENERLAAPEADLISYLGTKLETLNPAERGHGSEDARKFVEVIRDRAGLLRGRGDGTLEFSHRTFQEYLAAFRLAALSDDEDLIDAVMPNLYLAWWEEVHLLLVGQLGSTMAGIARVERLLLTILDAAPRPWLTLMPPDDLRFPSWVPEMPRDFITKHVWRLRPGTWLSGWQIQRRLNHWLARPLLFAVRAYGGCAPMARSEGLTARLERELDSFLQRWRRHKGELGLVLLGLMEALGPPGRCPHLYDKITAQLLAALDCDDHDEFYLYGDTFAQALGRLAADDPARITPLLAALKSGESNKSSLAAQALGYAALPTPEVIEALIESITNSKAKQALEKLAVGNPVAIEALLARRDRGLVKHDTSVIDALGVIGAGNPRVAELLRADLESADDDMRFALARALARIEPGNPAATAVLLSFVKTVKSSQSIQAGRALVESGCRDPEFIQGLMAGFKDSERFYYWYQMIPLLQKAGIDSSLITQILSVHLNDRDSHVRYYALSGLQQVGADQPGVIDALLGALHDPDAAVRLNAAAALGRIGNTDDRVIPALRAVQKKWDFDLSPAASEALIALGDKDAGLFRRVVRNDVRGMWRNPGSAGNWISELFKLCEGRQLPGYRWWPLRRRRELWQRTKTTVLGLGIGIVIWLLADKYAALPDTDPTRKFLGGIPAISGLLSLAWSHFQVVRGQKKTPWG